MSAKQVIEQLLSELHAQQAMGRRNNPAWVKTGAARIVYGEILGLNKALLRMERMK